MGSGAGSGFFTASVFLAMSSLASLVSNMAEAFVVRERKPKILFDVDDGAEAAADEDDDVADDDDKFDIDVIEVWLTAVVEVAEYFVALAVAAVLLMVVLDIWLASLKAVAVVLVVTLEFSCWSSSSLAALTPGGRERVLVLASKSVELKKFLIKTGSLKALFKKVLTFHIQKFLVG